MDVGSLRREFLKYGLSRKELHDDPLQQFARWFDQARQTDMPDPTAMILATVGSDGQPSQRTVLLKYFDENGFVFYTNYESRKAREMAENARVSLLFLWMELERQIKICGTAEKVSAAESAKYFLSRPKESQLAAWVSSQSHRLSSRQILMQKFQEMKQKIGEGKIPVPSFWGGYRVIPHQVEFWQGRENRLHDRFVYSKNPESALWTIERLAP